MADCAPVTFWLFDKWKPAVDMRCFPAVAAAQSVGQVHIGCFHEDRTKGRD